MESAASRASSSLSASSIPPAFPARRRGPVPSPRPDSRSIRPHRAPRRCFRPAPTRASACRPRRRLPLPDIRGVASPRERSGERINPRDSRRCSFRSADSRRTDRGHVAARGHRRTMFANSPHSEYVRRVGDDAVDAGPFEQPGRDRAIDRPDVHPHVGVVGALDRVGQQPVAPVDVDVPAVERERVSKSSSVFSPKR